MQHNQITNAEWFEDRLYLFTTNINNPQIYNYEQYRKYFQKRVITGTYDEEKGMKLITKAVRQVAKYYVTEYGIANDVHKKDITNELITNVSKRFLDDLIEP